MSEPTVRTLGRLALAIVLFTTALFALHPVPIHAIAEGGFGSYLPMIGLVLGAAIAFHGLRHASSGFGSTCVALGTLVPIASGVAGHLWATANVVRALAAAPPTVASALTAIGYRESLRPLEFGALASAAVAVVIAIRTFDTAFERATRPIALAAIAAFAGTCGYGLARFANALDVPATAYRSGFSGVALEAASRAESLRLALGTFVVLAILAIVAWAVARREREPPEDLALLVALAACAALVAFAIETSGRKLVSTARRSYVAHLDSFDPLRLTGDPVTETDLVVLPTFAVADTTRIQLAHAPLVAAMRRAASPDRDERSRIAIALDARATPASLRLLVAAARDAEVKELELHGIAPLGSRDRGGERADRVADRTFTRAVLPVIGATTIPLARRPAERAHPIDERIEVGASPVALPPQVPYRGTAVRPPRHVQLRLRDDVTATNLAATVAAIVGRGDLPFVVDAFEPDLPPAVQTATIAAATPPPSAAEPPAQEPSPEFAIAIRREFQRRAMAVRRCYERALARDPLLSGRADIALTVGTGGVVERLAVDTDDLPRAVTGCIDHAIRDDRFPDPGPGQHVAIHFPVVFSPAQ